MSKPTRRCEYSSCKNDPAYEAFCKWNGRTIYFCEANRPPWASKSQVTETAFYRVTPLRLAA